MFRLAKTKSEARKMLEEIVSKVRERSELSDQTVSQFIEHTFFPVYGRRWKESSAGTTKNRIEAHIIKELGALELARASREDLQGFLESKRALSRNTLKHLRFDLSAIFNLAHSEGLLTRSPAARIFVPEGVDKAARVMTRAEVKLMLAAMELPGLLICQLATLSGMRPGEIFALEWDRVRDDRVEIAKRIYKNRVGSVKTKRSEREAAISAGTRKSFEAWKGMAPGSAWVFPAEDVGRPRRSDTGIRAWITPTLKRISLGWATCQVMRRTHASLMHDLMQDPKAVSDQLGHTLSVDLNVYTQTSVEHRGLAIERLEEAIG